jgi:hypothetical protein
MNANELADWFDGRILYLWDAEDGQYYDSAIADEIVPMLRQQQAEIEKYKIAVFAMECFRNALETSVRRTALESVWEALDNLEEK